MEAMIQQMQFGFLSSRLLKKKCLTLSVEGEGRVSWISRIRTDKLYKLEDKRRITNETSRNVEYL